MCPEYELREIKADRRRSFIEVSVDRERPTAAFWR
jgi:hypothetical protein